MVDSCVEVVMLGMFSTLEVSRAEMSECVVDFTNNDSSVANAGNVEDDFVISQCTNGASLKDDFEASTSHWGSYLQR